MSSRVIASPVRLLRLHLLLRDARVRVLAEAALDESRDLERVLARLAEQREELGGPRGQAEPHARGTLTNRRFSEIGLVPLGERVYDERLEVRDELLGLRKEPSVVDEPRAHARLHALDEHAILGADLCVERQRLLDPGLVGVLGDEVVEEAVRPLVSCGTIGPIEKLGRPGITLTTVPGKRRWNWPRSTSPVGS